MFARGNLVVAGGAAVMERKGETVAPRSLVACKFAKLRNGCVQDWIELMWMKTSSRLASSPLLIMQFPVACLVTLYDPFAFKWLPLARRYSFLNGFVPGYS